jgi:acetyltransferase-like isoleucine patch superfamily enzyme
VHIDKGVILVAADPDLDLSMRDLKECRPPKSQIGRGELVIGDHAHIAQNCMIFAYGGVRLGSKCVLSAGSKLYSLTSLPWNPHNRGERGVSIVPYSCRSPSHMGPIELEENVWLGLDCVVFPGVTIERDCFARSNSLIMSSFPQNSYIKGDPARRVDERYRVIAKQFQKEDETCGGAVERIMDGMTVLAIVLPSSFGEHGVHFVTPGEFSQQLAYIRHPGGTIIQPHVHHAVTRQVYYTKEVLLLKKGKLRVDFYDAKQLYLRSRILEEGDVILLIAGGHGFEVLEEVEMIEVKQGPYLGEGDKTRFPGIDGNQARVSLK